MEEEKEDDSRNNSKIKAYEGESTENNLADMVKQIDKRKPSNIKVVNNEFSDEERELNILSPGSSCFESLVSENSSSVTTGSLFSSGEEIEDKNVEESKVEINEMEKDEREEKYEIHEVDGSNENEWDTDEEVDEVDDDDDEEYETEEEEDVDYRNLEENQDKNDKEIDDQNETTFYMKKKVGASAIESVSERSEESDNSSEYTTTDLEDENEYEKDLEDEDEHEKETNKIETKEEDEKAELMEKQSKEVLPKITSSLKVNLFTEELATEFIPVTQDLDKDIEIIEINANDFNQNNNNENDSKEKQNIDNLTEKNNSGKENNCTVQIEQKNIENKTTTKFNNKMTKNEKASFIKKDELKENAVKDSNKNKNLNEQSNLIKARYKLENVTINKKRKEQKTVMLENEETKNKKNEKLVTSSKIYSKKQIGKKIVGKKDKPELSNKENIKISGAKPIVNVSSHENQTQPLNVFERLSLNIKKVQNFSNKQTKNMKSTGQKKKSNNNLENTKRNEKLSNNGSNIPEQIPESKLERNNVTDSEEVISRSVFESIQKTIRQNLDLKSGNMLSVNENSKNVKWITSKSNQVISKSTEEKREGTATANKATEPTAEVKVHSSEIFNKSTYIPNENKKNKKIELDNDVDNKKIIRNEAVGENGLYQNCININKNEIFENESVKTFTLLRTQQNSRKPESRKKSNFKFKSWEENSEFNSVKTIASANKTNVPQFVTAANINYNTHNTKIANSLGFNTIPFIVGKSTSKSFHIGLNIQQTLSLINLSPSVPAIKFGVENKQANDLEKDSSFSTVTTATYKPKSCPACAVAHQDIKDDDEELILEDPWHVPQKDAWDQQNIASRKRVRCTCLPANIISFNEVLSQMFQAEGLMPSRPRSSTNDSYDSRQDDRKGYQENKKLIVRPNNATYLTRLLRNIQRIQDKYIVPITKLSLNGYKYNTP